MAKLYIELGCDPLKTNSDGQDALIIASKYNNQNILNYLLSVEYKSVVTDFYDKSLEDYIKS